MLSQSPRSAGMSVYALMQPQSSDDSPEFFRQLIERRFELALTTLPTRQEHTDAGLVADLGDIIIHLLSMVSKIADEIVDDRRIKQRAYGAMVEDRTARRYTLAMSLQDVDASHRILKDMQSTLKSTVDGFSQAWQRPPVLHPSAGHARPVSMSVSVSEHIPSPSSTFSRSSGGQSVHDPSRDPRLEGHQPVLIEPARIDKPSPASEQNYSRPSERSESGADNDALADPDMDALRNRGKGTYTFMAEALQNTIHAQRGGDFAVGIPFRVRFGGNLALLAAPFDPPDPVAPDFPTGMPTARPVALEVWTNQHMALY
ncbi:Acetolactate synthase small subunit [Verticillium dahliae VDG2]|nr:Acetolactate synthase small subunit [Verticillium dahliae VDG2]